MVQFKSRMTTVVIATAMACAAWGQEPATTNRVVAAVDSAVPPGAVPLTTTPRTFRPNFKDADFASIAQTVGTSTGRTVVVGPGVCAQVSATWETELTEQQLYEAFVSIARTLGFMVAEQGAVTTITLDDNARKDSPRCRQYPA